MRWPPLPFYLSYILGFILWTQAESQSLNPINSALFPTPSLGWNAWDDWDSEEEPEPIRTGPELVMAQFGWGLGGGMTGILTGGLIGISSCSDRKDDSENGWGRGLECAANMVYGGLIGFPIGTAIGIHAFNLDQNHSSSFWVILGATTSGMGLTLAAGAAMKEGPKFARPLYIPALVPVTIFSGIFGSRITAASASKRDSPVASFSVGPRLVALNTEGLQVELLHGRF